MRTAGIVIFSIVFAGLVSARSWCAFQTVKADADEGARIIEKLETARRNEGDIIEALLTFTKNSGANRSFVLAADPIRKDHAKSVQLMDEQIGAIRAREGSTWRRLSIQLFFDTLSLAALLFAVGSFVFAARMSRAAATRRPSRRKKTEREDA